MNFDFPTVLVVATFVTGVIWLLDRLFLAPVRRRKADAIRARFASQPTPDAKTAAERDKAQAEEVEQALRQSLLVEYCHSFFPVILVVLLLRSFLFEPFRIPSGSMMPTLLVGDFILVNKYAYGLRLPVLNRKVVDIGQPQRGDVVVFRFPRDPSVDYIKRVVGVPGDHIEYRDKTLYLNGEAMSQKPLGPYVGVASTNREAGSLRHLENLTGVEHNILTNPYKPDFAFGCLELARGPFQVPDGSYFVMGDNRDNSNDSRCWGLVPDQNLAGKAIAIWMSWDTDRETFPVGWERIGQRIQ